MANTPKCMVFKDWDGKDLKGTWIFSIKIDGIRAENHNGKILTRGGKPIYNLPDRVKKFEIAEICCEGTWNKTMSICTASKSPRRKVKNSEIYTIVPLDKRLHTTVETNPTKESISYWFKLVKDMGYEGLVLYNPDKDIYVKVKDKFTIDVKITGLVQSTAKSHYGFLKEFETDKGAVGIGITRAQREEFWNLGSSLIGTYIEVEVMEFTKGGMFRHPRFVRLRPDKS